jgi:hypothetical protein
MVVFIALNIFTFYSCSTSIFLTCKTLVFKSFLFNILYSFNTYNSILFLEIALRDPNSTYIMNPNVMASRNWRRISWFYEIVIVTLLLFFTFLSYHFYCSLIFLALHFLLYYIFLFLFIVRAFLWILVITRI